MSDYDIFAAMQEGREPLARYKKTIVGNVHVTALNPFSDTPEGILLHGNGSDKRDTIELWTTKQLVFFERMNIPHINAGRIIKTTVAPQPQPVSPNQVSDDDIVNLLNDKFLSLKSRVEKFTDVAPLLRMINKARELDKSEKIIKYLEQRMAQLEIEKYE